MANTRKGNFSGKRFEDLCGSLLLSIYPDGKLQHSPGWRGLYGQSIRLDFFSEELCVEFMWQGSRGTTDQKLPYRILQILNCHIDEQGIVPTGIVLGGGGFSPGAIKWAKRQVIDADGNNLVWVFTADEFFQWAISQQEVQRG